MNGSSCSCGKIYAEERQICAFCGKTLKPKDLDDDAILLSFTIIHTTPEGFDSPILLGLAELSGDAHLLCECRSESDLKIGRKGLIETEDGKHYFRGK
jgi:uncharacterized OB-fold protein